MVDMIIMLLMV